MEDPFPIAVPLRGTIRQLRPSDFPRFREHLLRLDARSLRDRFNGAATQSFLADYADRCFAEGATVLGYVEDDKVLGAAELHEQPQYVRPTAEIAFSVEPHLQGLGIGGMLFERLIGQARGLGYTRLHVTTHPQNAAMQALARRHAARLSFADGETVGVIELEHCHEMRRAAFPPPLPFSPASVPPASASAMVPA